MTENLPARQNGMQIGPRGIVPQNIAELFQLAELAVKSGLAPRGCTVEQAAGIMAYGLEIGLGAMAAFGVIASINGRVSLFGAGVPAVLQNSGKVAEMKEWFEGAGDNFAAHCLLHRHGQTSEYHGIFSVADARTASLWGKQGPWSSYPKDMLMHKARRRAADAGFSDVLKGIPAAEDVAEIPDMQRPDLVNPPGVRRSLPLKTESRVVQGPAPEAPAAPPLPPAPSAPVPAPAPLAVATAPTEPDYSKELQALTWDLAGKNKADFERLMVEFTTEPDEAGNVILGFPSQKSKRATPERIKRAYFKAAEAWNKTFGPPPGIDGEDGPAF